MAVQHTHTHTHTQCDMPCYHVCSFRKFYIVSHFGNNATNQERTSKLSSVALQLSSDTCTYVFLFADHQRRKLNLQTNKLQTTDCFFALGREFWKLFVEEWDKMDLLSSKTELAGSAMIVELSTFCFACRVARRSQAVHPTWVGGVCVCVRVCVVYFRRRVATCRSELIAYYPSVIYLIPAACGN